MSAAEWVDKYVETRVAIYFRDEGHEPDAADLLEFRREAYRHLQDYIIELNQSGALKIRERIS